MKWWIDRTGTGSPVQEKFFILQILLILQIVPFNKEKCLNYNLQNVPFIKGA